MYLKLTLLLLQVLPLEWLEKVSNIAAEHKIPVHMDGARVMNAAVYLRVTPKRIVRDVDSVCFCLSKGLGCPVGALLAGNKTFVAKYVFMSMPVKQFII